MDQVLGSDRPPATEAVGCANVTGCLVGVVTAAGSAAFTVVARTAVERRSNTQLPMASIALVIADDAATWREPIRDLHCEPRLTQADAFRIVSETQLHKTVVIDAQRCSNHRRVIGYGGAQGRGVVAARVRTSLRVAVLLVANVDDVRALRGVPVGRRGDSILSRGIHDVDVRSPVDVVHQHASRVERYRLPILQNAIRDSRLLRTGGAGYGRLLDLETDLVDAG